MKSRKPIPGRARMSANRDNKVLSFVNSPIGLWLLSTLFISIGSWVFTQWHDRHIKKEETEKKILRLDEEIGFRLTSYPSLIAFDPYAPPSELRAMRRISINSIPPAEYQMFPEYASRNMVSLIIELETLVEDPSEQECLDIALLHVEMLEGIIISSRAPVSESSSRVFLSFVRTLRWGINTQPGISTARAMIQAFVRMEQETKHLSPDVLSDPQIDAVIEKIGIDDNAVARCQAESIEHATRTGGWDPRSTANAQWLQQELERQNLHR